MNPYIIAFITGLTTGGLNCLAVQGGLLASSLAHQLEKNLQPIPKAKGKKIASRPQPQPQPAAPILLFLGSKLVVYTLLGFLLGALGSVLTLNTTTRAILLIAIGIFMAGNALRMLNVHPIFRYFAIEPPKFITRYIRRTAKGNTDVATPVFLGALTVFIPCGVTQAMMAAAIASGSPVEGAGLLFAFTLGVSPVFFIVAYLATRLGSRIEAVFIRVVAVLVLLLGLVSIDSGATLLGFRYSAANLIQSALQSPTTSAPTPLSSDGSLTLAAENNGYAPRQLHAPANTALTLNVVTHDTYSCSRAFVIPALGIETILPATGSVPIDIPPQTADSVMQFTCSMGMYTGEIIFDQ